MRTITIGLLIGLTLVGRVAVAERLPPVIQHLGPLMPTPVPSPKAEEKIRLISSLTVQNEPDGDSVISFEATDYGAAGDDYRIIASELYTLIEPKPAARALRDQIMRKLRDLESDLLEFVEITGPPRARDPVTSQQSGQAPSR